MVIAIRKEPNGAIYIDKDICKNENFNDIDLSQPPYNYTKVEVDDIYLDCIGADFNEDLTFSADKYNERKQKENTIDYENRIVAEIRKKYNVNQELAILRQRDTKPEEFAEYNEYVEQCKAKVKEELNK